MEEKIIHCFECEQPVEGENWTFCEKCSEPVHEKCIEYKEGWTILCSNCKL